MVSTRTGSSGSWVPPALTTMLRPRRSPFAPSVCAMRPSSSGVSASRPHPVSPEASLPLPGPTMTAPRSLSVCAFCRTAGCSHMLASIAGATSRGAPVASAVTLMGSSARPRASFASMWAVAGATASRSAACASATCSMASGEPGSNRSVSTGRWVTLRKVRGVTNRVAEYVMSTSTAAPPCVSLLARSAALYAAMLPLTPRRMRLPWKGPLIVRLRPGQAPGSGRRCGADRAASVPGRLRRTRASARR